MSGNQGIKCFVHMLRYYSHRARFGQVYLKEIVQTKRYFANITRSMYTEYKNTKELDTKDNYTLQYECMLLSLIQSK